MRRLRWCALLACAVMVLAGCGEDEPGQNDDPQQNQNQNDEVEDPPDSLQERCEAACARIYGDGDDECDNRFSDDDGAVSQGACVDRCTDEGLFRGGEWCVATEAECTDEPTDMIEACLPDDYHVEACEHLGMRPREYVEIENQVVEMVNDFRAEGVECADGDYDPVDELERNDLLDCAALLYNADWNDEDEETPGLLVDSNEITEWTDRAGYDGEVLDVLPNHGERNAQHFIDDWTGDDQSSVKCEQLMNEEATEVGFGYSDREKGTAIFGK